MRLIQLSVPNEQREAIVAELESRDLGYTEVAGTGIHEGHTVIFFLTPADAVEHVMADLEETGYVKETFTVSTETDFASFDGVDEVQDEWADTPNKIAPDTLRSKAKDMRSNTRSYMWMMVLSSIVATAGLLMSAPAVVVGSMVIAPIVGPMLTASIGAVRDDRTMLVDSTQQQLIGLTVAVLASIATAFAMKGFFTVPSTLDVTGLSLISLRLSPSMLSVLVGFTAGAAGAYGLATKGRVTIVGVMIAAALVPSAAAVGIGVVWGRALLGVGALSLLITSVVTINAGAFLMLSYLEYGPDEEEQEFLTFGSSRALLTAAVTALVVVAIVGLAAVGFVQHVSYERTVNQATTDVLQQEEYAALNVSSISVEYTGTGPVSMPATVSVTLSRFSDQSYSGLPNAIAREITARSGRETSVQVSYQDFERSNVSASLTARRPSPAPGPA